MITPSANEMAKETADEKENKPKPKNAARNPSKAASLIESPIESPIQSPVESSIQSSVEKSVNSPVEKSLASSAAVSSSSSSVVDSVIVDTGISPMAAPLLHPLHQNLSFAWQEKLAVDLPGESVATYLAISQWLVGEPERFEAMSSAEVKLAQNAMDYRYRIFMARYWGRSPEQAYKRLLQKLAGLFLIRSKVRTWIALSRDRNRAVQDVLQEVIQEMLQSDRHMQQQTQWIAQCTSRSSLRNLLVLATIEEYCLRPIRSQPLLVYRFVNYLRRSQRGGMTQVPSAELIQIISEEIGTSEADGTISLLDFEALDRYETQKDFEAQQAARQVVQTQFANYLHEKLGETAVHWLDLHLQGYAQEHIAQQLQLSVRAAYRLREKVSYHAIRIFTLKEQPDLVFTWLKTSLKHHNLGLTPTEWHAYFSELSESQQALLCAFKADKTVKEVAHTFGLSEKQVLSKWAELYLKAQEVRVAPEAAAS
jgi:DNA-binding NarL/FixJ family response regulator